jgi:hypothetical protein|tara:strand:+ start:405 stop:614 length:210 start_codon:yes stop_codon:yes gene_type:complete
MGHIKGNMLYPVLDALFSSRTGIPAHQRQDEISPTGNKYVSSLVSPQDMPNEMIVDPCGSRAICVVVLR